MCSQKLMSSMNGEVGDLAGKANGNVILRMYIRRQQ